MRLMRILFLLAGVSVVAGEALRGRVDGQESPHRALGSKSSKSSRSSRSSEEEEEVEYEETYPTEAYDYDRYGDGYRRGYRDRAADTSCGNVIVTRGDVRSRTYDCVNWVERDIRRAFPTIRIIDDDYLYRNYWYDRAAIPIRIDHRTVCDYDYLDRQLYRIERTLPRCLGGRRRGWWRRR